MLIKLKYMIAAFATIMAFSAMKAQELDRISIDFNQVEVNVSMDPSHYNELLGRFCAADTTLRLDEIATVYYGFPTTINYDPTALYVEVADRLDANDNRGALTAIREALEVDPVDLELLYKASVASLNTGDPDDLMACGNFQTRFHMLVTTIMATGKGYDYDRPFLVIKKRDADAIMKHILGVTDARSAAYENLIGYMFRFSGNQRDNVLYFNNSPEIRFLNNKN